MIMIIKEKGCINKRSTPASLSPSVTVKWTIGLSPFRCVASLVARLKVVMTDEIFDPRRSKSRQFCLFFFSIELKDRLQRLHSDQRKVLFARQFTTTPQNAASSRSIETTTTFCIQLTKRRKYMELG